MGKGAKNRGTARRTVSEKKGGKHGWTARIPSLPAFFPSLSPVRVFPHYPNAWDRPGFLIAERAGRSGYACLSALSILPGYACAVANRNNVK